MRTEVRPADPIDATAWSNQLRRMCRECPHRASAPPSGPQVRSADTGPPADLLGRVLLTRFFTVLGQPWALHLGLLSRESADSPVGAELMGCGVPASSAGVLTGTDLTTATIDWYEGSMADGCDGILCNWQDDEEGLPAELAHQFVADNLSRWIAEASVEARAELASRLEY